MVDQMEDFSEAAFTPMARRRISGRDIIVVCTWRNEGERRIWEAEQAGRKMPSEQEARAG